MKEYEIQVVVIPVNGPPEVRMIPNTLESFQAIVGGRIEAYPLPVFYKDEPVQFNMFLNEEGKLEGLSPNFGVSWAPGHLEVIAGDVVITGGTDREGNTVSLTGEEVQAVLEAFSGR